MSGGSAAHGGYRAALAVPDFRRLALGLLVDSAGSWAYGVVLLVYVFQRTHSTTLVGVTTVTQFLPGLLFSAYAGVVAERFERTKVLIVSSLGCFAVMTAMAVTVALHGPIAVLLVLGAMSSAIGTPFRPAVGALVPQLVDERTLAAANAVSSTIENVSTIAGPALGGALLLTGQPTTAFAFNALSFLVSVACLLRIKTRSRPTDVTAHGGGVVRQVLVGFRTLHQVPAARIPVLLSILVTVVYGTDTVLFVPVSHHLHGGESGYGYLLTALAIGGVAAAAVLNWLASRFSLSWSLMVGMAAYCLPTALIPLVHDMGSGLAIQLVRGAGTVVVDVLAFTALQRAVPAHLLSRVLGVFETLVFAACAAGALVISPVLHAVGLSTTLVLTAVIAPAIGLTGLPALLRLDRGARRRLEELTPTIDALAALDLLNGASRPTLERLADVAVPTEVPAGAVVVREGDDADAFYVVRSGRLEVTSSGEGGRQAVVATLGPDSYFGEIGILHGLARTATVRAVLDCALLRIDAEDFRAALETGSASAALVSTASSRLAQTHPVLARSTTSPLAVAP